MNRWHLGVWLELSSLLFLECSAHSLLDWLFLPVLATDSEDSNRSTKAGPGPSVCREALYSYVEDSLV